MWCKVETAIMVLFNKNNSVDLVLCAETGDCISINSDKTADEIGAWLKGSFPQNRQAP